MLFLLINVIPLSLALTIHKCCPDGQLLDKYGRLCIDDYYNGELRKFPVESKNDVSVKYNGEICQSDQSDLIICDDDCLITDIGLVMDPGPENVTFPLASFCFDFTNKTVKGVFKICPCLNTTCIRKCCVDGRVLQVTKNGTTLNCIQNENETEEWSPNFRKAGVPFYILNGYPSCLDETGVYFLNPDPRSKSYSYHILPDGSAQFDQQLVSWDQYCGETTLINGKMFDNLVICLSNSQTKGIVLSTIYSILLVVGSIFLLVTLIMQYLAADLRRSVHSRNLTAHVICLLIGYVILSVQSLGYMPSSKIACAVLGYLTQFSFLGAFLWLNVMSIDITWTFSGFKNPEGASMDESELKKFTYYSIYVWMTSSLIILITFMTDELGHNIAGITPDLGTNRCWFKSRLATLLFFYLPISILLLTNVVLFIYTSYKIMKVRRDTNKLLRQDGGCQGFNEFRFSLYLKLSLLMGISWIFEVISWAADNQEKYFYLYILADGFNALRGVFVFFLFCWKKRLINNMKTKLTSCASSMGIELKRNHNFSSKASTSRGDSSTLTSNQTQQTQTD